MQKRQKYKKCKKDTNKYWTEIMQKSDIKILKSEKNVSKIRTKMFKKCIIKDRNVKKGGVYGSSLIF